MGAEAAPLAVAGAKTQAVQYLSLGFNHELRLSDRNLKTSQQELCGLTRGCGVLGGCASKNGAKLFALWATVSPQIEQSLSVGLVASQAEQHA